jgi:hypothetical protein
MSADGNPAAPGAGFAVGRVVATTFTVLFENIFRFIGIIVVVGVPVAAFCGGGALLLAAEITAGPSGFNFSFHGPDALQILFMLTTLILVGLAYLLITCALIHGTLQVLAGRPISIVASLSAALSALPRVSVASLLLIIVGLLIALAAKLFLSLILSVFGAGESIINFALTLVVLIVGARIWVFIPAIMVDRAGILDCFGRSQELTRVHRWRIFEILFLITIANWIVDFASGILSLVSPAVSGAINIASAVFSVTVFAVLAAVVYSTLRTGKEGVVIDDIAKVFD